MSYLRTPCSSPDRCLEIEDCGCHEGPECYEMVFDHVNDTTVSEDWPAERGYNTIEGSETNTDVAE